MFVHVYMIMYIFEFVYIYFTRNTHSSRLNIYLAICPPKGCLVETVVCYKTAFVPIILIIVPFFLYSYLLMVYNKYLSIYLTYEKSQSLHQSCIMARFLRIIIIVIKGFYKKQFSTVMTQNLEFSKQLILLFQWIRK